MLTSFSHLIEKLSQNGPKTQIHKTINILGKEANKNKNKKKRGEDLWDLELNKTPKA